MAEKRPGEEIGGLEVHSHHISQGLAIGGVDITHREATYEQHGAVDATVERYYFFHERGYRGFVGSIDGL
jgi:hypothetical protein